MLESAFQFHSETKKKQRELSDISGWFDTGNMVGRVRSNYTIKFLNTLRKVIQTFDDVLHRAASSEQKDDLVQFRYSLITPLDASIARLNDLAQLLPDFINSNIHSSDGMMRQEAISKALHNLTEYVKEVHIHIALYEALLNVKPTEQKELFLNLGMSYKDMLADSHEMEISNLIEYCKRNNKYEELIQKVLIKHPAA